MWENENFYTRIDIKHTKRQEPKIAMSNTIGEIILLYYQDILVSYD